MPRPYTRDLRVRVIGAVKRGSSARSAGRLFGVSDSVAIEWVQRRRRTGSVAAKRMGGYRRSPLDAHGDVLLSLLADRPDLTVEEMQRPPGRRRGRYARFARSIQIVMGGERGDSRWCHAFAGMAARRPPRSRQVRRRTLSRQALAEASRMASASSPWRR